MEGYFIVRCKGAGAFAGEIKEKNGDEKDFHLMAKQPSKILSNLQKMLIAAL